MSKILSIILSVSIIISSFVVFSGCSNKEPNNTTIYDLATTKKTSELWLEENGKLVPYLVVEKNYHGQVLVLRKFALDDPMAISEYYSYYEDSIIDVFLNSDFLERLSTVSDYIPVSNISIMANEAIGLSGTETIEIHRKAFLLSVSELDVSSSEKEGQSLRYFSDYDNRICTLENGLSVSWWLRTPNTWNLSTTYVVGSGNTITTANSSDYAYVRPAFCIKPTTKVYYANIISENVFGYVLENNKL